VANNKKNTSKGTLKAKAIKVNTAPSTEPILGFAAASAPAGRTGALELAPPDDLDTFDLPQHPRWHFGASVAGAVVMVGLLLIGGFSLVYAGKVYPGVTANGVYLGGLSRAEASAAIEKRLEEYRRELIPINYEDTTIRLNPDKLAAQYDVAAAVDQALRYGRSEGPDRWRQWMRTLAGRPTHLAVYTYDKTKLYPYLKEIDEAANQPVKNATFNFVDNQARIDPAVPGRRVDVGRLTLLVQDRLARTSAQAVDAPAYELAPLVTTDALTAVREEANLYLAGPVTVKLLNQSVVIEPAAIVDWVKVTLNQPPAEVVALGDLGRLYALPTTASVALDEPKITAFAAVLAKRIDQPGQNAALTITDGRATVFQPSRDGIALNQAKTAEQIKAALQKPAADRAVVADVKVAKAEITEESINTLGINELLSEGISMFPGSTRERIQNVRVGASKFDGVLLKPGEVFSFGALLGDVGPETGYAPANVIIGNRQEKQYGGGLCQVSSTAFRAALNAGLPIIERTNHSYAVSYYTAPYGVPGVDATIYYPQVDFKFKNDTSAHILIQTVMEGTTLRFQFYGTKTKEGKVRGPSFITGSLDHTQPSHTVFYRDVVQDGKVIKTDTFHTYYQSSLKFPTTPQFNG
jgi:vancomycin resistance protein YoaR